MNFTSLNGGPLNGGYAGALSVVFATVTLAANAFANVEATKQVSAQTQASATAVMSVTASTSKQGEADLQGKSEVYVTPTHAQKANVEIEGSANLQAFVLRMVNASAFITTSGSVLAIPASTLASASLLGSATVTPSATRIQTGISKVDSAAEVVIAAQPRITRFGYVNFYSSVQTRAETCINGVLEAYADLLPEVQVRIDEVGLVTRPASAAFNVGTVVEVSPTHVKPGISLIDSEVSLISAEAHLVFFAKSNFNSSAVLNVSAVRGVNPSSSITGNSDLVVKFNTVVGSATTQANGFCDLSANGQVTRNASLNGFLPYADVQSFAVRNVLPLARINLATAEMFVSTYHQRVTRIDFTGSANLTAEAVKTVHPVSTLYVGSAIEPAAELTLNAASNIEGASSVSSQATVYKLPLVSITSNGVLTPIATRKLNPTVFITGFADVSPAAFKVLLSNAYLTASATATVGSFITRNGLATFSGHANLSSTASYVKYARCSLDTAMSLNAYANKLYAASSLIDTSVFIDAKGTRLMLADVFIGLSAEIVSSTFSNIYSQDPPERTYISSARNLDFYREASIIEFWRKP